MWIGSTLVVVSMVLGVLGVLFEGRDKVTNNVTKPGFAMIGAIVLAGLLGVTQQVLDGLEKSQKAAAATKLNETILRDIQRNLQPLSAEYFVTFEVSLPCERMSAELRTSLCAAKYVAARPLEEPALAEPELQQILPEFIFMIFREEHNAGQLPGGTVWPDITARFQNAHGQYEDATALFNVRSEEVTVRVRRAVVRSRFSNAEFLSSRDLDGAIAGIEMPHELWMARVVAASLTTAAGYTFTLTNIKGARAENLWIGTLRIDH